MAHQTATRSGGSLRRAAATLLAGAMATVSMAMGGVQAEPVSVQHRLAAAPEAVTGDWSGTMTGEQLPPEGAPFTLHLELDDEGALTGSFDLGEVTLDVEDAAYNEEDHSFSCRLVTYVQDQEVSADLTGSVDGTDMSGTIAADGFEAEFTASKEE